jgi:hypothetical protein
MKADDTGKKKGLLGSIWGTMTGDGSCCAPGNDCCSPKDANATVETEYHGDREILIKIYDPPMCCSSGVCGTNVNSALVEFSGALKSLAEQGIAFERWNLSQQPQAFAENLQVKVLLTKLGKDALPFIFVNDELKITGRYPKSEELFALLGIDGKTVRSEVCCAEGCCK